MAEYGDYKKEIKTLGDLRTFVNETLKGIEDNYTFDIDDNFMGIDIILTANCDVSYSEKSFYWNANVNYAIDVEKVIDDRIKAKHKLKAFEIIKKKRVDMWHLVDLLDQTYEMYLAFCKSEKYDNEYILTEEEFNLIKEVEE